MSNELTRNKLVKAGYEYERILEALRKHQQDYRRLMLDIGLRENGAGAGEERAIYLPDLPTLEEQEHRVAERLLSLAAEFAHRPGRITPTVAREDLRELVPLKSRSTQFSPERLAQELAEEMLGERGLAHARHQAAKHLRRHFGPHLRAGAAFCASEAKGTRSEKGTMIDSINSLRLIDWLMNLAMMLEANHLDRLLAGVDELIVEIENAGRATIKAQHSLEDGRHTIRLSLRRETLRVYLSAPLLVLLQSFADTHINPVDPVADSTWFRTAIA